MKQIEINYLTSTGYESLYPNVNCASITDFTENLYSKSEVDGMIQEMRNQTGDLKFAMGQYTGTELISDLKPGDGVAVGSWSIITVGFKPEKIILFMNGSAGNTFSNTDYTGGNFYSLPFYVTPYGLPNVNLIEARDNGFAARNGADGTKTSRVNYYFNQKDYTIYYFAFG